MIPFVEIGGFFSSREVIDFIKIGWVVKSRGVKRNDGKVFFVLRIEEHYSNVFPREPEVSLAGTKFSDTSAGGPGGAEPSA